MLEFICRDKKATIRAYNVLAVLPAFGLLPQVGTALLARHGVVVDPRKPSAEVPFQFWLNTLAEMQRMLGRDAIRIAARTIAKHSRSPATSIDAFLLSIDEGYYLGHTGNVGHYRVQELEHGVYEVRCETPYPAELELGLVEGFVERLSSPSKHAVHFVPGDNITHSCTLTVRPVLRRTQ